SPRQHASRTATRRGTPHFLSTILLAPEARQKLAGGEAQRNHRNRSPNDSAPAGAAENSSTPAGVHSAFIGFRWFRSFLAPPPANFCCASGVEKRVQKSEMRPLPLPKSSVATDCESQRDSAPKPRVARHELPWEIGVRMASTPTGLRPVPGIR